MSPLASATSHGPSRFPRVSGDEPGFRAVRTTLTKFSPRERG